MLCAENWLRRVDNKSFSSDSGNWAVRILSFSSNLNLPFDIGIHSISLDIVDQENQVDTDTTSFKIIEFNLPPVPIIYDEYERQIIESELQIQIPHDGKPGVDNPIYSEQCDALFDSLSCINVNVCEWIISEDSSSWCQTDRYYYLPYLQH